MAKRDFVCKDDQCLLRPQMSYPPCAKYKPDMCRGPAILGKPQEMVDSLTGCKACGHHEGCHIRGGRDGTA